MDYKIAIPSYKRYDTIKIKTLNLLRKYKIDFKKINVFVADAKEKDLYDASLQGIIDSKNIIIGVPTIGKQRNFIEKYYKEGTCLMMFDDDIEKVLIKDEKKLVEVDSLENDVIIKGFTECKKVEAKTFSIYAASNAYFMKNRIYNKLCYIIASMFGVIVEHDKFLERQTNHGEDYEYSIRQYIKNKILVRFDYLTVKSNYYNEPGGLQSIRTQEYIYKSIYWIYSNFTDYCTMYIRKSTGNAELRLKDKKL